MSVPDVDLLDGCEVGPIDGDPPEHLPFVVLFARALGIEDDTVRRRVIDWLADAYRQLFGGDDE